MRQILMLLIPSIFIIFIISCSGNNPTQTLEDPLTEFEQNIAQQIAQETVITIEQSDTNDIYVEAYKAGRFNIKLQLDIAIKQCQRLPDSTRFESDVDREICTAQVRQSFLNGRTEVLRTFNTLGIEEAHRAAVLSQANIDYQKIATQYNQAASEAYSN